MPSHVFKEGGILAASSPQNRPSAVNNPLARFGAPVVAPRASRTFAVSRSPRPAAIANGRFGDP